MSATLTIKVRRAGSVCINSASTIVWLIHILTEKRFLHRNELSKPRKYIFIERLLSLAWGSFTREIATFSNFNSLYILLSSNNDYVGRYCCWHDNFHLPTFYLRMADRRCKSISVHTNKKQYHCMQYTHEIM